jgi:hypothetical protein
MLRVMDLKSFGKSLSISSIISFEIGRQIQFPVSEFSSKGL